MMKILYLDESGDHNLIKIDPMYPVFVLGGVIVEKEYADHQLTLKLNEFKMEMFGNTDIILHTADIVRFRNGFEPLIDQKFREKFNDRLSSLMGGLEY